MPRRRRLYPGLCPNAAEGDHIWLLDSATMSCPPEERCLCGQRTWAEMERALREFYLLESMWRAPSASVW